MERSTLAPHDARIAELEARLADAEETLRAIRSGEVDALLVTRADGDQVFTLQGAETTYRLLIEEMNEGALLLGPEGTVLYSNTRFAQLVNDSLEQIIGSRWERYFAEADQSRLADLLVTAQAGSSRQEFLLQTEAGPCRPVSVSVCSMRRAQIDGFSAVVLDLTERKSAEAALRKANEELDQRVRQRTAQLSRANEVLLVETEERKKTEQELRASEAKFRSLFYYSPDAVLLTRPEGTITAANPAACAMFGMEEEEICRVGRAGLLDAEDPTSWKAAEERERTGQIIGQELRFIRKNGQTFPAEVSSVVLPGTPPRAFVIIRDITERKVFQARLEQLVTERTAKMQEMIDELQHVSYSIVHDMRAPLRAIQGFAALLAEEPHDEEKRNHYCQRIIAGTKRIDMQITDALQYTNVVLQEVPFEAVDLSRLMQSLVETYPDLHPDKSEIIIEGVLPVVSGNESLLAQCFSNLLGNAVKFVQPGTKPRVRVWAVGADGEGRTRIWIEDNGIGIPHFTKARLFGMFQRLATGYEGTGIGLAIVRKVVERMGGKVGVDSEEGQGSRFWVELGTAQRPPACPDSGIKPA